MIERAHLQSLKQRFRWEGEMEPVVMPQKSPTSIGSTGCYRFLKGWLDRFFLCFVWAALSDISQVMRSTSSSHEQKLRVDFQFFESKNQNMYIKYVKIIPTYRMFSPMKGSVFQLGGPRRRQRPFGGRQRGVGGGVGRGGLHPWRHVVHDGCPIRRGPDGFCLGDGRSEQIRWQADCSNDWC